MDSQRFDAIIKSAATPATRRAALGLLAGGLLGGLLPSRKTARAAQPEMVELFPEADVMLSCAAVGLVDCAGTCCATDETCIEGVCLGVVMQAGNGIDPLLLTCAGAGLVDCDGTCVDAGSDNFHCGACYNSCPLGGFCQGGTCVGTVCFDGLTNCGRYCADLLNDAFNCGTCGVVCPNGPGYCTSGYCVGNDTPETGGGGGSAALDCGGGKELTDEFGRKTGFCAPVMHEAERPYGN